MLMILLTLITEKIKVNGYYYQNEDTEGSNIYYILEIMEDDSYVKRYLLRYVP